MRIIGIILLLATRVVAGPTFTHDPASPSLVGGRDPADTLLPGRVPSGPVLSVSGATLGLQTNYPAPGDGLRL